MNNKVFHSSETMRVGLILAMVGGFMDTYSYVFRGQVFANAQTGNIILFGIGIHNKNYENIIKYYKIWASHYKFYRRNIFG